jgi:hypothetical protein
VQLVGYSKTIQYAVAIAVYKIAEHWALGWVQSTYLEPNAGRAMRLIIAYLPVLTWLLAAAGLIWTTRYVVSQSKPPVSHSSIPEFFSSRSELNARTGGIQEEIKHAREAWLVTHTGAYVNSMGVLTSGHLKRLVVVDPRGEYLERTATVGGNAVEGLRPVILETTQKAARNGVDVRWSNQSILGVFIANPEDDDAYARVEILVPHWEDRVGFRVYKREQPELFQVLKRSFERTWDQASQPGIQG